jgi:ankyrin repeat protein
MKGGADDIFQASKKGDLARVKELVEAGADLNAKFRGGDTALVNASQSGHLDIVKYLVEKGANVNVKNGSGLTPTAMGILSLHLEIVKYLIEKGANVNQKNALGGTLLMTAAYVDRPEIVKYLIEKGADIDAKNKKGDTACYLAKSPELKALLCSGGGYDIFQAIKYYIPARVKDLVEAGANVNAKENDGSTPLIIASQSGHLDIVKYLVEKGANVNAADVTGVTALMFSSKIGYLDIVKYLVEKGADINAKDKKGKTACDLSKTPEIKALLCPPPPPPVPTGECSVPSGEADPMTAEDIKNGDVMALFADENKYGRYWTVEGYNLMLDWNHGRHDPPRNPVTKIRFDPTKTTYCTAKIVAGGKRKTLKNLYRKRTKKFKKTRKQ